MPGEAGEGQGQLNPLHRLPDGGDQTFVEGQDLLLVQEAHLHVQLGELRLAIGPQVFVAEAAGDLVIALQAAHHQQLLEQLGRLGQGKPLATAHPARHQVVAGAFGGGAGEDRRFHLDEAALLKELADRSGGLVAEPQVAIHALPAQIQIAMPQPQLFAGVLLVVHRHGEGEVALHGIEHGDGARQHLEVAGGQAFIDRIGRPLPQRALHLQHRFVAQVAGGFEHRRKGLARPRVVAGQLGIHRDLHGATAVAQVDEDHAAVVAAPVDPAAELDGLADLVSPQIAAPVAAHG